MSALRALFAMLLSAALAACGGPQPEQARVPVAWVASKPNPAVGRIRAAVVERPAPDRAALEARWEAVSGLETCELELVLPEGALLVEGVAAEPLPVGALTGTARWLVEFPVGRDLDAVVRFCAHTEAGRRASEVAVRLTSE